MNDKVPSVFKTEKYWQNRLLLKNYLGLLLAKLSADWNRTDPKWFQLSKKKKSRSFRMEDDEIQVVVKDLLDVYQTNEGCLNVTDVKTSLVRHSVNHTFYVFDDLHVDNGKGVPLNFEAMDFSALNSLFQFVGRNISAIKVFPAPQFDGKMFDKMILPFFKEAFSFANLRTYTDYNFEINLFDKYPSLKKGYERFKFLCKNDCEGKASFLLLSSVDIAETFSERLLADCCDLKDLNALDEAFEDFKMRSIPKKKSEVSTKKPRRLSLGLS